jgi:predicted RNase H-like HicB family nuclease
MPVFIEKDNKWFVAFCPSLQGCYTQGKTLEEALKNIREVIELHIEDRVKEKEPIPSHKVVSMNTLEIAV